MYVYVQVNCHETIFTSRIFLSCSENVCLGELKEPHQSIYALPASRSKGIVLSQRVFLSQNHRKKYLQIIVTLM